MLKWLIHSIWFKQEQKNKDTVDFIIILVWHSLGTANFLNSRKIML